MILHLQAIGTDGTVLAIEVGDDCTAADVVSALAERRQLDPASVRLVFNHKVIPRIAPVSTLATTAATPIKFFAKPIAGGAPAAPSPLPSPAPAPDAAPAPAGLAELAAMGYDAAPARRALELARGRFEVAVELLLGGDVSEAGLARVSAELADPLPLAAFWPQIFEVAATHAHLYEALLAGAEVHFPLAVPDGLICVSVRAADFESLVQSAYGMGLREFLAAGGIARLGNRIRRGATPSPTKQEALDAIWVERYQRMAPVHRAAVERIAAAGVEIALAAQLFVGCGGDWQEIQMVLAAMR
jgi:hypothetical protein